MSTCLLPITVRRFVPRDVERLAEIGVEAFEADALLPKSLLRLRRRCFAWSVLAELEGEIIGYMVTCVEPRARHIVAHVMLLAVDVSYRRQGVGSVLVEWSLSNVQSRTDLVWELEVRANNEAGLGFWQSFGFREIAIKPQIYRGKIDGILMRRF